VRQKLISKYLSHAKIILPLNSKQNYTLAVKHRQQALDSNNTHSHTTGGVTGTTSIFCFHFRDSVTDNENGAANGPKWGATATNGALRDRGTGTRTCRWAFVLQETLWLTETAIEFEIHSVIAQCMHGQNCTSYGATPLHSHTSNQLEGTYITVMMNICEQLGPLFWGRA
jgi:hypothetical protein